MVALVGAGAWAVANAPSVRRIGRRGAAALALLGAGAWVAGRARRGDSLAGEVALVTGGSRGLGFVLAERLLREGCRVAICGRDPEALERARARLSTNPGGEVIALRCDISDAEAVQALVEEVVERFGSLDLLVNNASIIQVAPLEALELDDFRRAIDIDFMGMVHTTLSALPHMRARGSGRIVNITSIGGKVAVPHLLPYDAAKFAAVGFSEGLRAEVARDGIRVTTIVPGLMRTGSPVHVEYRGQPGKEYVWFVLGDLLPVSAMSVDRAARRIVRAIRRGEAEVTLSWQAKLLRVAHDISPGGMSRLLSGIDRLLPDADGPGGARGRELRGSLPRAVEATLDRLADRTNQTPARSRHTAREVPHA